MKALVVDDDRVLADLVAFALSRDGFEVIQAHDGATALRRWSADEPDIVILDINLPDTNGFEVCRQIRQQGDTPIVLLTVRGDEDDVVRGLELGADDYITKPFSPRQLLARTRAVLRRVANVPPASMRQSGDLTLDLNRREAQVGDGQPIALTPLEGRLLDYLMVNAGNVVTTEAIIDHVWGPDGADRDMLRQLVRRLRAKLEPDPAQPTYIETVSGIGYGLRCPRGTN